MDYEDNDHYRSVSIDEEAVHSLYDYDENVYTEQPLIEEDDDHYISKRIKWSGKGGKEREGAVSLPPVKRESKESLANRACNEFKAWKNRFIFYHSDVYKHYKIEPLVRSTRQIYLYERYIADEITSKHNVKDDELIWYFYHYTDFFPLKPGVKKPIIPLCLFFLLPVNCMTLVFQMIGFYSLSNLKSVNKQCAGDISKRIYNENKGVDEFSRFGKVLLNNNPFSLGNRVFIASPSFLLHGLDGKGQWLDYLYSDRTCPMRYELMNFCFRVVLCIIKKNENIDKVIVTGNIPKFGALIKKEFDLVIQSMNKKTACQYFNEESISVRGKMYRVWIDILKMNTKPRLEVRSGLDGIENKLMYVAKSMTHMRSLVHPENIKLSTVIMEIKDMRKVIGFIRIVLLDLKRKNSIPTEWKWKSVDIVYKGTKLYSCKISDGRIFVSLFRTREFGELIVIRLSPGLILSPSPPSVLYKIACDLSKNQNE